MFKTGNNFIDSSLTVFSLFPLLPVILILFKKSYLKEPMNFLMIVCLLDLAAGGMRQTPLLNTAGQSVINNIFALLELVFLALLFRPALGNGVRNAVNVFLIAFLSAILTFFCLKGWAVCSVTLDTIEAAITTGIILLALPPLIRSVNVEIFQSPLVWIAGGTLFYFFTLVLLELVGGSCLQPVSRTPDTEKMILLAIAGLIRYFLYTGAVLVA